MARLPAWISVTGQHVENGLLVMDVRLHRRDPRFWPTLVRWLIPVAREHRIPLWHPLFWRTVLHAILA